MGKTVMHEIIFGKGRERNTMGTVHICFSEE
jgi:hypothetical protein